MVPDPRAPRRLPRVLTLLGGLARAGLVVGALALVAWPVHSTPCYECGRHEPVVPWPLLELRKGLCKPCFDRLIAKHRAD